MTELLVKPRASFTPLRLWPALALALVTLASHARAQETCFTATPIAGEGWFPFDTTAALVGPTPGCSIPDSNDIWFEWSPTVMGDYSISICGASYDVVLAAYNSCGGVELECDDGFASGVGTCSGTPNDAALALVNIAPGSSYFLQVTGWGGETGTGVLEIDRVNGDDCATAVPITGDGSFPFDTTGAVNGPVPGCSSGASFDIWFEWTPTVTGSYGLSICGASYDVVLAAYDSCGGVELECDDGFAGGFGACTGTVNDVAIALVNVAAGTSYLLQVTGWSGDTGMGELDIQLVAPEPCGLERLTDPAGQTGDELGGSISL